MKLRQERESVVKEYGLTVHVTSHGEPFPARLKIIRLPGSWYAVLWESPERYASSSQDQTPKNGGFAHMTDAEFMDRVRLVIWWTQGIAFEIAR